MRLFVKHTGPLAVLTLLLAACSSLPAPQSDQPASRLGAQGSSSKGYLLQVKATSATTPAKLAAAYPGSTLLSLQSAQGYALLAVDSYKPSSDILSAEKNVKVKQGDASVGAQGFTTWAGGFTAWAGGFTAWAGGTTTNTSFSENSAIWNRINLGSAQQLIPELGKGVTIAVIDSGLDLNHPAFQGKLDLNNDYDYVDNDTVPQDVNPNTDGTYASGYGHGTAVAGVILQIAPNATLLPLRVLSPDGSGDVSNVISAIERATSAGAKIINLSLGSMTDVRALNTAIGSAAQKGVIFFSSTGNTGDTAVTYPAANSMVLNNTGIGQIGVGSVSPVLLKSSFSTYGQVEMTAIGENVKTLFPGGLTVRASGTSFSAPMAAGVAALVISTSQTGFYPNQSTALLKNMLNTAQPTLDPVYGQQLGSGTLNALSLVKLYR
ncbi:S8 family peptidase [Deinococcus aerophilus]|uniref:Peptidase S8/S53 domain-containing protein n=1 Tax=Deinococcus aerophilus TaxID=522488 RepID=A0ABQ2GWJ2_9DEIO|nr:S8 family serine peptidase [Deinococcus aerophilus]GGM15215.1 hypothetical protein GCM10010841_24620 [Deinococcus aerophilus]